MPSLLHLLFGLLSTNAAEQHMPWTIRVSQKSMANFYKSGQHWQLLFSIRNYGKYLLYGAPCFRNGMLVLVHSISWQLWTNIQLLLAYEASRKNAQGLLRSLLQLCTTYMLCLSLSTIHEEEENPNLCHCSLLCSSLYWWGVSCK